MNGEDVSYQPIDGGLKSIKVRNIISKLVNDSEYPIVLDDDNVSDLIEDLMSEDMVDKDGNNHRSVSISCGNTIVSIIDNQLEKFQELMKNISPQELKELKKRAHKAINKSSLLQDNLDDVGIDIDNIESYLGTVEVLTIERRRIYNVYEVKEANKGNDKTQHNGQNSDTIIIY